MSTSSSATISRYAMLSISHTHAQTVPSCCVLLQLDAVWYKKEKSKGQSTCEALIELTEELQVDILVVGSFGRKGERMYDVYHCRVLQAVHCY